MKQAFFSCAMLMLLSIASNAQETAGAPYNPDSNADSLISVPDILSIIPLFGQEFLPSEDDLDSTNEIQSLYISNDTLYLIPNGGFILLGDIAPQINLDSLVSSLSVDSVFLANVGGLGNTCNLRFPDGLVGEYVLHDFIDGDYVVPPGKNLYITALYADEALDEVQYFIDDVRHFYVQQSSNSIAAPAIYNPILTPEGATVSVAIDDAQFPDGFGGAVTFYGYLMNASVDALNIHLTEDSDYTVPDGFTFVLSSIYSSDSGNELLADDTPIWDGAGLSNHDGGAGFPGPKASLRMPLMFDALTTLHASDGSFVGTNLTGYLVNEGYFADCGISHSSVSQESYSARIDSITCTDYGVSPDCITELCDLEYDYTKPIENATRWPDFRFTHSCDSDCQQYPSWYEFTLYGSGLNEFDGIWINSTVTPNGMSSGGSLYENNDTSVKFYISSDLLSGPAGYDSVLMEDGNGLLMKVLLYSNEKAGILEAPYHLSLEY